MVLKVPLTWNATPECRHQEPTILNSPENESVNMTRIRYAIKNLSAAIWNPTIK